MDATSQATMWAFIALLIFLAILVYVKAPGQIAKALDKRSDQIKAELDEARRLREEAEGLLAAYQKKAVEAKNEAADIVALARREAEALTAEARQRTEEYVVRRTKLAEDKIAQAEVQAIQEVKALSADVAIAAAEKILSAKVRGEAADAMIKASIGELKNRLN